MIAVVPFILIVLLILCVYFFIRNCYVYQFRNQIIDRILDFEEYDSLFEVYENVSYNQMVLSFKRLTLENWYPKEFCEKLKR
jgi:hypothetical protein